MLVAMAGLPGVGKSTLARRLAAVLPRAVVLDKDPIRAALFPLPTLEYSTLQDDFVVDLMLQTAGYLLDKDPAWLVILDGRPFSRAYQVLRLAHFCEQKAVPLRVIHCTCPDEAARQRLELAARQNSHLAANRSYALYLQMKAAAEPVPVPCLEIDTTRPVQACLFQALDYLFPTQS